MAIKYKTKLRDLKLEYLKEYVAPIFNFLKPKKKITNISDLKEFIQKKSAWVSQETLYGYLKTRMGAKYILMFDDEIFLGSINKAKWNIYAVALQDLTFYCLSYLKNNLNVDLTLKSNDIYEEILNEELKNEMPNDIIDRAKKKFNELKIKKGSLKRIERLKRMFTSINRKEIDEVKKLIKELFASCAKILKLMKLLIGRVGHYMLKMSIN